MAQRMRESNGDHGNQADVPYRNPNNTRWQERNSSMASLKGPPPRLGPSSFSVDEPSYQAQRDQEPLGHARPARRPVGAGPFGDSFPPEIDMDKDGSVTDPRLHGTNEDMLPKDSYRDSAPEGGATGEKPAEEAGLGGPTGSASAAAGSEPGQQANVPSGGEAPPPAERADGEARSFSCTPPRRPVGAGPFEDSFPPDMDKDKDVSVTYPSTNEDMPSEEHLRLQQSYEARAQITQAQADNALSWVDRIMEELCKRPTSEAGPSAAADAAPAPNPTPPQRLASPCREGREKTSGMPLKSEPAKDVYGDSAPEEGPTGESPAEEAGLGGPTGSASAAAASEPGQRANVPAGGEAPAPAEPGDGEAGSFSCTPPRRPVGAGPFEDSFPPDMDVDKDGSMTYHSTNEDIPPEEHVRLQQSYEARAQITQARADNALSWVDRILEELCKRPTSEAGPSAAADAAPAPNPTPPQRLASPCREGREKTSGMPLKSEPAKDVYGDSAPEEGPTGESPAEEAGLGGLTGSASAAAGSEPGQRANVPAGGEAPAPAEPGDGESGSFSYPFPASKFKWTDKNVPSSKFGIVINGQTMPFQVQITASGGQTFRASNGRGTLMVTSKVRPERFSGGEPLSLTFIVGSLPETEPVKHNFAASTTLSLPGELDFLGNLGADSNVTVTVRVAGHRVVDPYAA